MVFGRKMCGVMLMALFFHMVFRLTESSGTTDQSCSWGSWLPWGCSCCGNSRNIPVYRVRAQCCEGTSECWELSLSAHQVKSTEHVYSKKGTCLNDCGSGSFGRFLIKECTSKKPGVEEITAFNKTVSCSSVCLESAAHQQLGSAPATTVDLTTGPATTVDSTTGLSGNYTSDESSLAVQLTARCRLVWGIAMALTTVLALNYK